jgi:hypothetical protein
MDGNSQWLNSIVHKHHHMRKKSLIDQDFQVYDKQALRAMYEEI